jgi:hypothetical protein
LELIWTYAAASLFVIFLSIFLISFYLIKVANKKYLKQNAIIKILSDELIEKEQSILILQNDNIIFEYKFIDSLKNDKKQLIKKEGNKINDIKYFNENNGFSTKKIIINNTEYSLIKCS